MPHGRGWNHEIAPLHVRVGRAQARQELQASGIDTFQETALCTKHGVFGN